jgi:hypothetical protein
MSHLLLVLVSHDDLAIRIIHEVEETICTVAVMSTVRQETELPVEKNDGITFLAGFNSKSLNTSKKRSMTWGMGKWPPQQAVSFRV